MANEISDAALIERYIQLRDYIRDETAKHDEWLKPYADGMKAIEQEFLTRLNARFPDPLAKANSATDFGTAFRVRRMTAKVVDQNQYLKFCFDHWNNGGSAMLRIDTVAEPLKEWLGKNIDPQTNEQKFPPGVEVDHRMNVNIRKS